MSPNIRWGILGGTYDEQPLQCRGVGVPVQMGHVFMNSPHQVLGIAEVPVEDLKIGATSVEGLQLF